jgi:endogenous inhibitor of DNA gyrase (YacG/DUF329 family)
MTTPSALSPAQTLRYAELPIVRCNHCGGRFEMGLRPFCSSRCERAHAAWLDADPRRTTAQRREAMVAKVDRKGGAR